jgi:hypothetical protein
MREGGQLQLEAIICFSAFLAILALFLASINEAGAGAEQAVLALKAKAEAERCCIVADAVYASNVLQLFSNVQCTAEGSIVKSEVSEKTKESECLAKEIRLVQQGNRKVLEVRLNDHYG